MLTKRVKLKQNCESDVETTSVIDFNLIIISSLIAIANIVFYDNFVLSALVVLIELTILVRLFLKKDITNFFGYYLIFLSLSLEFDVLVGTSEFYGFKNFNLFGVNLALITILPVIIYILIKGIKIKEIKTRYKDFYIFGLIIVFISFTSLIMGLVNVLINDNNIQALDGVIFAFIGKTYSMMGLPILFLLVFSYLLTYEKEKFRKLESYLVAIFFGLVASMIASLISENFGVYDVQTLLVSNIIQYIPLVIVFPLYKRYNSKMLMITGVIGMILALSHNAQGKLILMYLITPIAAFIILVKRKRYLTSTVLLILLPLVVIISINGVQVLIEDSILFKTKYNQAISLLNVFDENWLMNMAMSPKVRIIEIINIFKELFDKPHMLFVGKGIMGTVVDHFGLLGSNYIVGSYSIQEWNLGSFYNVHGTYSLMLLYNGLIGFGLYMYMIIKIIKNFFISPWFLVGGYWFIFGYGFSMTISSIGVSALLLALASIERNK